MRFLLLLLLSCDLDGGAVLLAELRRVLEVGFRRTDLGGQLVHLPYHEISQESGLPDDVSFPTPVPSNFRIHPAVSKASSGAQELIAR